MAATVDDTLLPPLDPRPSARLLARTLPAGPPPRALTATDIGARDLSLRADPAPDLLAALAHQPLRPLSPLWPRLLAHPWLQVALLHNPHLDGRVADALDALALAALPGISGAAAAALWLARRATLTPPLPDPVRRSLAALAADPAREPLVRLRAGGITLWTDTTLDDDALATPLAALPLPRHQRGHDERASALAPWALHPGAGDRTFEAVTRSRGLDLAASVALTPHRHHPLVRPWLADHVRGTGLAFRGSGLSPAAQAGRLAVAATIQAALIADRDDDAFWRFAERAQPHLVALALRLRTAFGAPPLDPVVLALLGARPEREIRLAVATQLHRRAAPAR